MDGPKQVLSGKSTATKWKLQCPNCNTEDWKFSNTLQGKKYPCKKCYDNSMRRSDMAPAIKRAFMSLKSNAKARNIEVSISEEEFFEIASTSCNYCGSEPVEKKPPKKWQQSVFLNGIDRINNSIGYIAGNICSCCEQCNWAKKDLSLKEWYLWIDKIIEKRMSSK